MSYFPMMVNLEGARVLVIGGGEEGRIKRRKSINGKEREQV